MGRCTRKQLIQRSRGHEIRFKELGRGRDGGQGDVKSFRTNASNPKSALRKLRKRGRILSIRPA